ncbi:alpha/beta fold hydrolase [Saccharibacillus kuerlensis]|uniref:AB hydrolase-1 domain-containing protein n=1 Tax=Saccharibacillus kuerlensis TaxID=459527 RepID=A0ABQ2L447_9BACL|nr:alpha/beta hydrolase [Saccharibacillus kuerlensis]GGO02215.1 hypothetical protein GCM10010969_25330 [Saccharibacillus kuerlensis]
MREWNSHERFQSSCGTINYGVEGEGEAVVFVHGTPWSSYNWRHVIRELSCCYKVYYYDLLGYGQSEQIEGQNVSLGIQNNILDELLDHWQLRRPILIGHDFGGTTILRTHLLNGRDAKCMILIDPVATSPWGSPFFAHVREYEEAFAGVPSSIHKAIVSAYVRGAQFHAMSDETLLGILKPWTGERGQRAFLQTDRSSRPDVYQRD